MIVLDTHIWHWWINQIPGKLSLEIITLLLSFDTAFPAYRELDGRLSGRQ